MQIGVNFRFFSFYGGCGKMKVIKNINNNISLCLDSRNNEVVAFGKGIGFTKPPYDVPLSKIDRTFYDVDEEQLWEDVSAVTAQALDRFVEMRAAEGAKMKADVESRLAFLEQCVGKVEALSAGRVENYTNRLYEKLKVILQDRDIDDARVLTEAAIFGDKTAVDEETVRLRSHIAQYRDILQLDEPVGRKLDFLTQELNRETNTIGSKCQDLDITRIVVDMKAEIEKIREQIQNLE